MHTEAVSGPVTARRSAIATARILRLAFGTAISLWVSQAIGWSISYIAPVVTMFLLTMPLSRPKLRFFIAVILAMSISVYGSFIFLPFLLHQEAVGLLLVSLALFHSFYFTARGGNAGAGALLTIAIALTVAVGSVSVDALLGVARGLVLGALAGSSVAALSFLVIRDPPEDTPPSGPAAPESEAQAKSDASVARHVAMRSLVVVAPIVLWFLLSGGSASNIAVMVKVAAMGQEASRENTRDAAKSLIISTLAGGISAVVAWQLLSIWPSLLLYTLLIAFAGLVFGQRIFEANGLRDDAATWSYAFLTMIVVLAPAALDSNFGSSADARFYDRLFMFIWATVYGVGAVYIFDALWSRASQKEIVPASTD